MDALDREYQAVLREAAQHPEHFAEVNHCHGSGQGHPCGSGGSRRSADPNSEPITTLHVNGTDYPIHTLPRYSTPYYYSPAHGGSVNHFTSLRQLKNHMKRHEARRSAQRNFVTDKLILHR